jgi:hypothetical protein
MESKAFMGLKVGYTKNEMTCNMCQWGSMAWLIENVITIPKHVLFSLVIALACLSFWAE